MSRQPNARWVKPDGTVTYPYLNAIGYSTARRMLDVGDQIWCNKIIEKVVDPDDGEVVMILEDGSVLELQLP